MPSHVGPIHVNGGHSRHSRWGPYARALGAGARFAWDNRSNIMAAGRRLGSAFSNQHSTRPSRSFTHGGTTHRAGNALARPDGTGGFACVVTIKHFHKHKGKKRLRMNMTQGRNYVRNNEGYGIIAIPSCRQNNVTTNTTMNSSDMSNLISYFNNYAASQGGSLTTYSQRIFIKKCVVTTIYTNAASTTAEIIIYTCMCRRDLKIGSGAENPDKLWSAGVTTPFEGDGATPLTGGDGNAGYWGTTPNCSKLFKAFWKIKKVNKAILAPGQTLKYTLRYKVGSYLPTYEEYYSNVINGWTVANLAVCRSMQAVEDGTGAAGWSDGKIILSTNEAIYAKSEYFNDTVFATTSGLAITAASEEFINVDSGLLVTGGNPTA